jgi:hypothetical protein
MKGGSVRIMPGSAKPKCECKGIHPRVEVMKEGRKVFVCSNCGNEDPGFGPRTVQLKSSRFGIVRPVSHGGKYLPAVRFT